MKTTTNADLKLMAYNMRKARTDQELTQQQLAYKSGVNINVIYGYERGMVCPGIRNLVRLADALHISLDEYIGRQVTPRKIPWKRK